MKEKSLLIIGAGQYGHVVKEIAILCGEYQKIDFLDDNSNESIGKISDMEKFTLNYSWAIVAIGNPSKRKAISTELLKCGYKIATIIHPQTYVSSSATIGFGCVIEAGVVVNTAVAIEDGCFICPGTILNYNCVIEEYAHVNCNVVVEASGRVPRGRKIESGSVFAINDAI